MALLEPFFGVLLGALGLLWGSLGALWMAQVEVLGGLEAVVGGKNHEKPFVFAGFSISSVLGYIGLSWSYVAPS